MFVEKTLADFNDVLGSDAPAPGGGSIAALSGSLGAELVSMVCNLSCGREALADYQDDLQVALETAQSLASDLLARVDFDTEAFNEVMAAFKLPRETDEQKSARTAAIQAGYRSAIASPLATAEACMGVLRCAMTLKGKINPNTMSDFGVGVLEAWVGLEGAVMNVRINLPTIKDQAYVAEMGETVDGLLAEGAMICADLYTYVCENLG